MDIFGTGERQDGHDGPVLNERAVRAGAGLLFLAAFIGFMNAWLLGDLRITRWFVLVFVLDMALRVLVHPRWAPSLVLGQWIVRGQVPEWVSATPKRFAWALGLALGLLMIWLMVVTRTMGPLNLLLCGTCLTLMFLEAAFGICLGCKLHAGITRKPAVLCPGGVCDVQAPKGGSPRTAQWLVLGLCLVFALGAARWTMTGTPAPVRDRGVPDDSWADGLPSPPTSSAPSASSPGAAADAAEAERCRVPAFAKAIGHEEKWKRHNGCL